MTDTPTIPDPPPNGAPVYFSSDQAYGWDCGWTAGYAAAVRAILDDDGVPQ